MPYIIFAALLLVTASGIFSLYRQLQILQQNSYSLSGYLSWIKESYTMELALSALAYSVLTWGIIKNKSILTLILAVVLIGVRIFLNILFYKNSEKKLLFTARVKRLYIAAIILLGVLILVSAISSNVSLSSVCRTFCSLLSIVTPVLTVAVWGITYPIE